MGTTDPTTGLYFPDTSDVLFPAANWAASFLNTINSWMKERMRKSYVWANAAARGAQAGMVQGSKGYQTDTDVEYRYDGSAWRVWEKGRTTYAFTWTGATSTGPTITGFYSIAGGIVTCHTEYVFGTTPSMASISISNLPYPIDTSGGFTASTSVLDGTTFWDGGSTTTFFQGVVRFLTASSVNLLRPSTTISGVMATSTTSAPWTPVAGNRISTDFSYPAA